MAEAFAAALFLIIRLAAPLGQGQVPWQQLGWTCDVRLGLDANERSHSHGTVMQSHRRSAKQRLCHSLKGLCGLWRPSWAAVFGGPLQQVRSCIVGPPAVSKKLHCRLENHRDSGDLACCGLFITVCIAVLAIVILAFAFCRCRQDISACAVPAFASLEAFASRGVAKADKALDLARQIGPLLPHAHQVQDLMLLQGYVHPCCNDRRLTVFTLGM